MSLANGGGDEFIAAALLANAIYVETLSRWGEF